MKNQSRSTDAGILTGRMWGQGLMGGSFGDVEGVLQWMGCVQAQDFGQAKWALGMRCGGAGALAAGSGARASATGVLTDADVEAAFNAGRLLRTHVLRPTWHFVLPADIGWMLKLTAPRVKGFCRTYHKQLGIDAAVLKRSKKVIVTALERGGHLERSELAAELRAAKIDTSEIRMNFLLIDAELDGLICSGPRKGKQFTYALLEAGVAFDGDAALAELARRYFRSRGPATVADWAWWSGMTIGQARRGLEMVAKELERMVVGQVEYWWGGAPGFAAGDGMKDVLLLPAFDEYTVGYKDRTRVVPEEFVRPTSHGLKPVVLVRGRVAGMWKRRVEKGKLIVEVSAPDKWSKATESLVKREARRFGVFAGDARAIVTIDGAT